MPLEREIQGQPGQRVVHHVEIRAGIARNRRNVVTLVLPNVLFRHRENLAATPQANQYDAQCSLNSSKMLATVSQERDIMRMYDAQLPL